MFDLKPLSPEAVPAALEKAMRYRLLNEPLQAESICRDVLRVDADNQEALVTLVLALSDQFRRRLRTTWAAAQEAVEQLTGDYEGAYYRGILCERRAAAHHHKGGPGSGHLAYDWYRQAMAHYDEAAARRPPGNDDPILRWNTCARILNRHPELQPAPDEAFQPLLE